MRGRVLVVHDPHRLVLRRALRVAVVVPIVFAVIGFGFDRTSMATFAAFGSFAMPVQEYLAASYYERWFHAIETLLVEKGVLTEEEVHGG